MRAWDPVADGTAVLPRRDDLRRPAGGARGADAAVLVTEWPQLAELDWARGRGAHAQPAADRRPQHARSGAMREAGFTYEGIGRAGGLSVSLPAVILVGGLGTRLRPLTDRTRKDMLPLVDRPQLAYTFEHLRRLRRHPRDRLVRLPADADPGALRRPLRRPPARVQDRGGAARHRRRDPLRRRGHRRAVLRAQRRLAAGDRPRRARRLPPRAARRARRSCSRPSRIRRRYGLVRVNGDGQRAQLPREAAAGGDRHEPDQRRPVRARAGRARPDPGRAVPSRSSARSSRSSSRSRRSTASRSPATGSTSGPRTPICRPIATCSSATSSPSSATRSAPTTRSSIRRPR